MSMFIFKLFYQQNKLVCLFFKSQSCGSVKLQWAPVTLVLQAASPMYSSLQSVAFTPSILLDWRPVVSAFFESYCLSTEILRVRRHHDVALKTGLGFKTVFQCLGLWCTILVLTLEGLVVLKIF